MNGAGKIHPSFTQRAPSQHPPPPPASWSMRQPTRGAEELRLRQGVGPDLPPEPTPQRALEPEAEPQLPRPSAFCHWCGARVAAPLAAPRFCASCGGGLRDHGAPAVLLRSAAAARSAPPGAWQCGPRPPAATGARGPGACWAAPGAPPAPPPPGVPACPGRPAAALPAPSPLVEPGRPGTGALPGSWCAPRAAEPEAAALHAALPSEGSALHAQGRCKPCAFVDTTGCENGSRCKFCHICDEDDRRRRRAAKRSVAQAVKRRQVAKGRRSSPMAQRAACLRCDVDKQCEGAGRHVSRVADASEATIRCQPRMTRCPNLGAHEPVRTGGPGPAVPSPPSFTEELSSEQRWALTVKPKACLPDDVDELREGAEPHPRAAVEAPDEGPAQAKIPSGLGACGTLWRGALGAAVPLPTRLIGDLSAEQRRALGVRLEHGPLDEDDDNDGYELQQGAWISL
ncbi:unnamed protein product [Prorocentrum cordatum]|uniref:C3H1-type domain-containing protein n=1 Tax=Prorocentrum cordatum TaxID=2364126 RepID=A0ABN9YEG8_9DINO|nr:unnamed protein product [Polarella glacialis]